VQSFRELLRPASRRVIAPLVLVLACGTATACSGAARAAAQAGPAAAGTAAAGTAAAGTAAAGTAAAGRAPVAGTTVPGAPGCPMFPADNVWNTDISKLPVNSRSAAWMRSMDSAHTFLHPDFGPDPGGYPFGIPFNIVTNGHRLVRIRFADPGQSDRRRYPFGPDTRIEGGKSAGANQDRHAIMVNSGTCTLYELFAARFSATRPRAGSGAIWNLESNALRPAGWTSADAAGLPILPGLLNYSQVKAAVKSGTAITHAIRFTAQSTRSAFIWPARHEASLNASKSLPPMGARFRLKASFSIARICGPATPYCRDARVILTEMKHYGLILADNGSNWFFQGSAFPQWPNGLISLLKRIPAREFQAVNESCLMVSRNSGEATAKPACPIG
jgi:hypothetical protein